MDLKIPVVDLCSIGTVSFDYCMDWKNLIANNILNSTLGKEIDQALFRTGFVYLKNTGISPELVEAAFKSSHDFFNLDESIKDKYRKKFVQTPKVDFSTYSGYIPPGTELEGDADYEHKEAFDICGNRKFPDDYLPEFRQHFTSLEKQLKDLTLKISYILGIGLDLENVNTFVDSVCHLHDVSVENTTTLRALYYPPLNNYAKNHANAARCAAHTDYGYLTLLLMEENATGLEVKTTEGNWIRADPIPGAVLMNVADFLELWSDNRYTATFHRVQLPTDESSLRPRKTIAYFVNPDNSVNVKALNTKFNRTSGIVRKEIWNSEEHVLKRSVNASYFLA